MNFDKFNKRKQKLEIFTVKIKSQRKNDFSEVSRNLTKYKSENSFVELSR